MAEQVRQSMFQIIHESMPLPVSFDVLRILFVISGRIRVLLEEQQKVMNRSDIFLINPMEEAEIYSDETGVVKTNPLFAYTKDEGLHRTGGRIIAREKLKLKGDGMLDI